MSATPLRVNDLIDRAKITPLQYTVFILCGLAFGLDGMDTQLIGYIAPALLADFGVPRTALGPVFSSGLVGLFIGALILSPLADKFGRKFVIIASVFTFGFFTLLSTLSGTIEHLAIWRFLTGLGLGAAISNILALVSDYAPTRRRSTILMLMAATNPVGAVLGATLASYLVPVFGWRIMFIIGGVLPILLCAVLWFKLDESLSWLVLKGRDKRQSQAIAEIIGGPLGDTPLIVEQGAGMGYKEFLTQYLSQRINLINTVAVMCVYFMIMFDMFFLGSWLTTLLTETGMPTKEAIHVSSLFQTGGLVGMLILAFALSKLTMRFFAGMLIAACAVIVLTSYAIGMNIYLVSAMVFLTGFLLLPCLSGGGHAVVGKIYPVAIRATAFGLAFAAGRLGSVFGPVFGQNLHAWGFNTQEIFMLSAVPCVIAALAVMVVVRNSDKQAPAWKPVTE
jgi:AAHS family 4-hydroxybenzoate transporter-like MFS transporter